MLYALAGKAFLAVGAGASAESVVVASGSSWPSLIPGITGLLLAAAGVIAQARRSSPENIAALKQRVETAERRNEELAEKVDDLQDKLLDQSALLFNAQAKLVAHGLMTREELENPSSTRPVVET